MGYEPKVTIGMPVYNGENFIEAAITSILAQSFEDFELLISDNASTDRTRAICERFASEDGRVRYIRQRRNLGAAPNYNLLVDESRGEYFKWAAHDDVLAPDYLKACVRVLDTHPSVTLAYPRAEVIDAAGDVIERYDVRLETDSSDAGVRFRDLLLSWHRCYEIFGLFRKSALTQTDLFETFWGADRTLLQEVALLGPFFEIPRFLFHPRTHSEQSITKMRGKDVDRTYWSDSSSAGRVVMPAWNVVMGNLRLVQKMDMPTGEKARLCGYLGSWALRHRNALMRDVTRATRLTVGAKLPFGKGVPPTKGSASASPKGAPPDKRTAP